MRVVIEHDLKGFELSDRSDFGDDSRILAATPEEAWRILRECAADTFQMREIRTLLENAEQAGSCSYLSDAEVIQRTATLVGHNRLHLLQLIPPNVKDLPPAVPVGPPPEPEVRASKVPVPAPVKEKSTASTKPKDWVEFEIVEADTDPAQRLAGVEFSVTLPGDKLITRAAQNGIVKHEKLKSGNAAIEKISIKKDLWEFSSIELD